MQRSLWCSPRIYSGVVPVPSLSSVQARRSDSRRPARVALEGVYVEDLERAARLVVDQFTPAGDDAEVSLLKNQHKMLLLSAAGENIILDQHAPVVVGTTEELRAVLVGDPLVCVGVARVEKDGSMTIGRDNTAGIGEEPRPFFLGTASKMEIGAELRRTAASKDTASWIFAVPAGALLAAGTLVGVAAGVRKMQ